MFIIDGFDHLVSRRFLHIINNDRMFQWFSIFVNGWLIIEGLLMLRRIFERKKIISTVKCERSTRRLYVDLLVEDKILFRDYSDG